VISLDRASRAGRGKKPLLEISCRASGRAHWYGIAGAVCLGEKG